MSMRSNRIITPFIVVFILAMTAPAFAGQVIYVDDDSPTDFNNIQAAIDDAIPGDTVIVADGIYTGLGNRDIDFLGKAIAVRSENGPQSCIINCELSGRGFVFQSGEQSTSVLDGFTISNAYASYQGGAIYCIQTSPMIKNCIFSKNTAYEGGGVFTAYKKPTLINCLFVENTAEFGGGIDVKAVYGSEIGATLINCTLVRNHSYNHTGSAGGIDIASSGRVSLTNCILWDNTNMYGSSLSAQLRRKRDHIINYCCIKNLGSSYGGVGNIDADPCFVDLGYWDSNDTPQDPRDDVWIEGDYHLLQGSLCIDTGDPNYPYEPNETDLDGRPRVIDGRIDMGAYEYSPPIPAEVRIIPRTINLNSKGKWITCYIWLPEGYDVADIDPNSAFLEYEIQPEQLFINEQKQVATAIFSREEVQTFLNIGEVELTIRIQSADGTVFEGTDVIKVVQEGGGKLAKIVQASNPNPADGATNVVINADLSWTASPYATSHNVYFGTSSQPPFIGNQTVAIFDPGTMDYEKTYYWHIDEVSKWGITTGQLWRFTTIEAPPPPPPGPGPGPGPGPKPPGSPPGCFPADTPVWIDGEQVQFSKVTEGRKIGRLDDTKAESCIKKPECLKEIESVLEYEGTDDYYNIVLENGNRINVVHSHYFLTASDQWVLVENLKAGSKLQSLKGSISIKTVSKSEEQFTGKFYNLKIKGGDRYYVGKDGVTVRGH